MLIKIIIILVVLWAFGFGLNLGGNLVHTLLVVALIAVIIRLLS